VESESESRLFLRQRLRQSRAVIHRPDIALSPKQDGPALNYFVYPYVEVDGKPYDKLDKQFSFEEVKSSK
jgi:hypothetical protein